MLLSFHGLKESGLLPAVTVLKAYPVSILQAPFSGCLGMDRHGVGVRAELAHFIDPGVLGRLAVGMQDIPVGKGSRSYSLSISLWAIVGK